MAQIMAPEQNTMVTPGTAVFQIGMFVLSILGLSGLVYFFDQPPRPFIKRQYPFDGLVQELGGDPYYKV